MPPFKGIRRRTRQTCPVSDLKKSSVKPARCIILGTVTASINDKEAMAYTTCDLGGLRFEWPRVT